MSCNRFMLLKIKLFIFLCGLELAAWATAEVNCQKRWLYVSSNLYVNENISQLEQLLKRAADAGYNGILFNDFKLSFWWKLEDSVRWQSNAEKLRALTRQYQMELAVCVFPFGYSSSLLWHDANLAAGMPVRQAPLKASDGVLVPVQTAQIRNGSFEENDGNRVIGFDFQDGPGESSFIDREIKKHGSASLRFEHWRTSNPAGNGRICQTIEVRPFQQYRIRAWLKTENLRAGDMKIMVLADGKVLQYQHLQAADSKGRRYIGQPGGLTLDWSEQSVCFNSLDYNKVSVYAGVWGGTEGKIWWDDLRIESDPAMNILRRASLPMVLEDASGQVYREGVDVEPIADPLLGQTPWPGNYDTLHDSPRIRLMKTSRIREGSVVLLSCYHASLVYEGQVTCSLTEPRVFDLCRQVIQRLEPVLQPDIYFLSHDEIRDAGWEPEETRRFATTGQALAWNVKNCISIIHQEAGGKPIYIWSDMFDPFHNARNNFYLVNNTLEGSWEGLSPDITIMKWGSEEKAREGLKFFADRGHSQMIAAYYDGDVEKDYRNWTKITESIGGINGVMYTTWNNDYSNLEQFASAWWMQ